MALAGVAFALFVEQWIFFNAQAFARVAQTAFRAWLFFGPFAHVTGYLSEDINLLLRTLLLQTFI